MIISKRYAQENVTEMIMIHPLFHSKRAGLSRHILNKFHRLFQDFLNNNVGLCSNFIKEDVFEPDLYNMLGTGRLKPKKLDHLQPEMNDP